MRTWLKNATLIDGTGAPARDGSLVIEGETIVHVGPLAAGDAPSGADTQVLDLAGRTVIPGLVEAHIHLSYNNVKVIADLDLNCPPEYSTLVSARNAELALSHGYTAARSAGSVHGVDVALKRAINEGLYPGPRLLAASRDIVATGGMSDWNPSYLKLGMDGLALIADGADQIRIAVRRSIKDGADVIKCYVGGDALLPHTPIADCTYTLDEVRVLVEEAHMRGRIAAAHVRGARSSRVAAQAGVDSHRARHLRRRRDAAPDRRPGPHPGAGAALSLLDHRERAALRHHRGDRRAVAGCATRSSRPPTPTAGPGTWASACARAATSASPGTRTASTRRTSRSSWT